MPSWNWSLRTLSCGLNNWIRCLTNAANNKLFAYPRLCRPWLSGPSSWPTVGRPRRCTWVTRLYRSGWKPCGHGPGLEDRLERTKDVGSIHSILPQPSTDDCNFLASNSNWKFCCKKNILRLHFMRTKITDFLQFQISVWTYLKWAL